MLLHSQQTQFNLIWLLLLRVQLEAVALEVLDSVALMVGLRNLFKRLGKWKTKLGKPAVAVPVFQYFARYRMTGFGEPDFGPAIYIGGLVYGDEGGV
jgi:hypothetical protein